MTIEEIREAAIKEYKNRYTGMLKVRATEVAKNAFGGHLVTIRAETPAGREDSEIVFVRGDHTVKLFKTTEELVEFLGHASRFTIVDRLADRSNLAVIITLIALAIVAIAGFNGAFRPEAFGILAAITGAASGYFFQTMKS